MVLLAWLTLSNLDKNEGWRAYMLFSTILPSVLAIFSSKFPESARWYVTVGEFKKAENTIKQLFKANGVQPIEGRLVKTRTVAKRGKVKDIFVSTYRMTSFSIMMIFLTGGMSYAGTVFISERLFTGSSLYSSELITAVAEFPAVPIGLLMNKTGRKQMLCATRIIETICLAIVAVLWGYGIGDSYYVLVIILVFTTRVTCLVNLASTHVYIIEYYPTAIRATSFGLGSALNRSTSIGADIISRDVAIVTALTVIATALLLTWPFLFFLKDISNIEMTNAVDYGENLIISAERDALLTRKSYVILSESKC